MRGRGVIGLALVLVLSACSPSGEGPPHLEGECAAEPPRMSGVVMAGSGSNLPLVRALVARYAAEGGEGRFQVPESIGTSGGLGALNDGVIDVGLSSRPLREGERRGELVVTPAATSVVVLVVESSARLEVVTRGELASLFSRPEHFGEERLVPIYREPGDSSLWALDQAWPEVAEAMEAGRQRPEAIVAHTDQEMVELLSSIPRAVGVVDLGLVSLSGRDLRPLTVDGVAPSVEAAESGDYAPQKPLFFVTRGAPEGHAASFLRWWRQPAQADYMRAHGYLPPQ